MRASCVVSCVIVVAGAWGSGSLFAADDVSAPLAKEVTAEFDNVTLSDALAKLAEAAQAHIKFGVNAGRYRNKLIQHKLSSLPLEKYLSEILEPLELGLRVRGGTIFVVRHRKDVRARLQDSSDAEFLKMPLQDAVYHLSDFQEVNIVLSKEVIANTPITFAAVNGPFGEVLTKMLRPSGLTYKVEDNRILILPFHPGPWTAEDALRQKVQAKFQEVRLENVAAFWADRTHSEIIFDSDAEKTKGRRITYHADEVPLKQALQEILAPLDSRAIVRRDQIHITRVKKNPQDVLKKPVSVLFLNTRLDEAVQTLSTLHEVEIVVTDPINDAEPIRYRADGKPLSDALSEMLRLIDATYEIQDGCIVIKAKTRAKPNSED